MDIKARAVLLVRDSYNGPLAPDSISKRTRPSRCRLALPLLLCWSAANSVAQMSVLTYHNDRTRSGLNPRETMLTPANVTASKFGKLFVITVDGKVDAQPLYLAGLTISGGTHNVLFVATEHDSLYAFDADTGATLWHVLLLQTGETSSDDRGCSQVTPEIGITSTPAIDRTATPNPVIYAVSMSKDAGGAYHQRLHALDVTTGREQLGGPVEIQAKFPGSGDNSSGGNVVFDPKQYKERAGLLLLNGMVYTAFSSHCDFRPYTSWVMGYDARTLSQVNVINLTPNGNEGAIWGAGAGPAADSAGNIYLLTGNGTFDTALNSSGLPSKGDFGNAFVKLSTTGNLLQAADYFTMSNTVAESDGDEDLGSGGGMLLPDLVDSGGLTRHLMVGAGKDGKIYLADRDNMGKFNPSADNIYQEIAGALGGSVFSSPAYFNQKIYYGAVGDSMRAFQFTAARLSSSSVSATATHFAYPGATPGISANVGANGIVWAVENSNGTAVLHAYSPANLATELYNSTQASGSRDSFGADNKFITPTIVNGKVYAATTNGVGVFGLLGQPAPAVFEPESLPATTSGAANQVFSWPGLTDGKGTILNATAAGAFVTFTANVPAAGTYDVRVAVLKQAAGGIWQLSIDGRNQGSAEDTYGAQAAWEEFDLGLVSISSSGPHAFQFTVTGKNGQSRGYRIAFDYMKLIPSISGMAQVANAGQPLGPRHRPLRTRGFNKPPAGSSLPGS